MEYTNVKKKKKKRKTCHSLLPPSVSLSGFSFCDIHFQKWKFNRRLWCKSQAITLCGVEARIKPSNHSRLCLGASNVVSNLLDHPYIFNCAISASYIQSLRFAGPQRKRKFRELPTWIFLETSHGGKISKTPGEKKNSLNTLTCRKMLQFNLCHF